MANAMIKDITAYMEYLKTKHRLSVTVHPGLSSLEDESPYNTHSNPYCTAIKENVYAWDKCIKCQSKVFERCRQGAFWGMCYAGVEEYVMPVCTGGRVYGFLCVSGYAIDKKKAEPRINAASEMFMIDRDKLFAAYGMLSGEMPDIKELEVILKPLCYSLELLWEKDGIKEYEPYFDRGGADYVLGRILSYAQYNFREKTSLKKIAAYCRCSESYVSHLFKKRYGVGINTYINRVRAESAKKLLENGTLSISDIAQQVGFSDSNYFANVFREYAGKSPSEYRKAYRKNRDLTTR